MKKLLYSVTALLTIVMVGCTEFVEPYSESYAPAPDFSIDTQVTVADSSATLKVIVDKANTTRFTVALLNDSLVAEELPTSMTLLKGNVTPSDRVCLFNADTLLMKNDTTVTYTFKNLLVQIHGDTVSYSFAKLTPNTSYTFVAVVSNRFGNVSGVKSAYALTTDMVAPSIKKASGAESKGSLAISFSETIKRGAGNITAKYYAPFDLSVNGTISAENIHVNGVPGKDISIVCDSVPAGALVLVSWETGAFTDIYGNNLAAAVTEINMTSGKISTGCYYTVDTKPFSFTEDDVEGLDTAFVDYKTFKPTIGYSKILFVNYDENDNQPKIALTYTKGDIEINLPATWTVLDSSVVFAFSKEMEYGAKISFSIPEGAVVDAYGNPNKAFSVDDAWMRSYGLTVNDILGVYDIQYASAAGDGAVEETQMLITRSGDGVKVSRLFYDDACLDGYFDGDLAILYIEDFQLMTTMGSYYLYFATGREDGYAQLQFNPETNSFSSSEAKEIGIYVYIPSTGQQGWMDYSTAVIGTYSDDQTIGYSKDLMLGNYRFIFHDGYSDDPESSDTITCEIVAGPNDTTLILKDFSIVGFLDFEGSEIEAYFDSISGKLVIPDFQELGEAYGYAWYLATYDLDEITFYCSPDGTAVTDATESEEGLVMGIFIMNSGGKGFYMLADGDVVLEPYEPEPDPAAGAPLRKSAVDGSSIQPRGDKMKK